MKLIRILLFVTIFIATLSISVYGVTINNKTTEVLSTEASSDIKKVNGIITSNWGDFFNVTRLQARITPGGRKSFVQAMFLRFPNKIFITESLENTLPYKSDPNILQTEIYLGGPLYMFQNNQKLFGWVTRLQAANEISPQYSLGFQYNISDHDVFEVLRKRCNFTTFFQIFPIKNDVILGNYDLLNYYCFTLYKNLYMRGYNRFFIYYGQEAYIWLLQDFILPINPLFDVYLRQSYQNRNNIQYGDKGCEFSLGCRLNFSF